MWQNWRQAANCWLLLAGTVLAGPRVWIADQGDNQSGNNRIFEIDPVNHKTPPDSEGDVIILSTLPSPALSFLDELSFDDQQRLWCVVKDEPGQETDGAKLINPLVNPAAVMRTIRPTFPGEALGGILEGLAFDGSGLWISAVKQGLTGNLLTRVSPVSGQRIAPFDTGSLGLAGKVSIPGSVAQGLLFQPPTAGRTYGYLWHSDVGARKIWKLELARLYDGDPANDSHLAIAEFPVPFNPKGMDWMDGKIWVASPRDGIWEFDPATGGTRKLFSTPNWNIDGVAILDPKAPVILPSVDRLNLSVWIGSDAAGESFTIRNGGPGTMIYSIEAGPPWLELSPLAGSCEAETDTVLITYRTANLRAGTHVASVSISSPEATNSPQLLRIQLTVQTVVPDFDGDRDVDQEDFGRMQACYSGQGFPFAAGCSEANFDGDIDVDVSDFEVFVSCLTAPGRAAIRGCDGR